LEKYVKIPFKHALPSKENIVKRDNHQCQYCGKHVSTAAATLDHIIPESRGGKNTFRNLVTACLKCNTFKADRTPEEAKMKLMNAPFTPTNSNLISKYIKYSGKEEWSRWCFDMKD
jgi:5-methylcytosine-specific restriction endonuclease McrA